MDPEEIGQDQAAATEQPAQTTEAEPVSLSEAMWGDKQDEDTVLPAGDDETTKPDDPDAESEAEGEKPAEEPDGDKKDELKEDDVEVSDEDLVKDLSAKAQQRFRELANANKDMERRLSGFTEVIEDAQVTPQDMVDLLAYGKAIRTGNFDQARAILAEQARQLEIASGKPIELKDSLSDYPDLLQGVEDMELTRGHALELARVRKVAEETQRQVQQSAQRQTQEESQQQSVQDGFKEVVGLTGQWKAGDIDWSVKEPLLIDRANMIQQNYPPHQWGKMLEVAYQEITATLKAARPATQQRHQTPLRSNAIGGGAKAPASLHEAMWGEPEPQ